MQLRQVGRVVKAIDLNGSRHIYWVRPQRFESATSRFFFFLSFLVQPSLVVTLILLTTRYLDWKIRNSNYFTWQSLYDAAISVLLIHLPLRRSTRAALQSLSDPLLGARILDAVLCYLGILLLPDPHLGQSPRQTERPDECVQHVAQAGVGTAQPFSRSTAATIGSDQKASRTSFSCSARTVAPAQLRPATASIMTPLQSPCAMPMAPSWWLML